LIDKGLAAHVRALRVFFCAVGLAATTGPVRPGQVKPDQARL